MNVYGTCIATTHEEAKALEEFMMERLGLTEKPKQKHEDIPHNEYVYAVFDYDGSIIILFATHAEAQDWVVNYGLGDEQIKQIRLGEEL